MKKVNTLLYSFVWKGKDKVEHFFRVYIASSKHEEGWENSDSYANPRRSRWFAKLSRIRPTLRVFR